MLELQTERETEPVANPRGSTRLVPEGGLTAVLRGLGQLSQALLVREEDGRLTCVPGSRFDLAPNGHPSAYLPPLPLQNLGDASFRRDHGVRYAYVTGAMANGIGSCDIEMH